MYCTSCFANLPEHFNYCSVCGQKTNIKLCHNCGQGLSNESRYCSNCGYEKKGKGKQLIWSGSDNYAYNIESPLLVVSSDYEHFYNPSKELDIRLFYNKDYRNEGDLVDREYLYYECLTTYFPDPDIIDYTITSLNYKDNNLIYSVRTEYGDDYMINEKYDQIYKHSTNKMSDFKKIISDLPPIDKVLIIGCTIYVLPIENEGQFIDKSLLVYNMSDDLEHIISNKTYYDLEDIIKTTNLGIVVKKKDNDRLFIVNLHGKMQELRSFININKIINNVEFISIFKDILDLNLEESNVEYKLLKDHCLEIDFERNELYMQNNGNLLTISFDGSYCTSIFKKPEYAYINKTNQVVKIKKILLILSSDRYISTGYAGEDMSFGLIIHDDDIGYIFMPISVKEPNFFKFLDDYIYFLSNNPRYTELYLIDYKENIINCLSN